MAPVCIMTLPRAENTDTMCKKRNTVLASNVMDHIPNGSNKKKYITKLIRNE